MITAEEVRELLDYDPETGVFTWRERSRKMCKSDRARNAWNSKLAGKIAGSLNALGYVTIALHKHAYYAHRLAWLHVYGRWPKAETDHRNEVKSDNRISNLREASSALNKQNRRRACRGNTSGLRGVCWFNQTRKWHAQICVNGKKVHLGYFDCKHEAHAAYLKAKAKFHSGYIPAQESAA